ncbi:MAG: DNA adenine methylase [Flavobacteriaceae bacterium]|nr:DNA adenine methylase [Flavobacteriaceae bacterium]
MKAERLTFDLFGNRVIETPDTEGIKYTGSKKKLLPHIIDIIINKTNSRTILDGFSGSTRVSQALAKLGYDIISNDISVWSRVFGTCYLLNNQPRKFYKELITELNNTKPIDGWFSQYYGGFPNGGSAVQKDGLKRPWQIHNTRKLDGIREKIDQLRLSEVEKAICLTSLILALDKVDSTLGHYVAYLREWSPRSYYNLNLEIPKVFVSNENHMVTSEDAFSVASKNVDLAYYDPPYGSNNDKMPPSRVRYASYYHLWTTICLNDKPKLFGKSMRRNDSSDKVSGSVFEEFRRNSETGRFIAVEAIERLIRHTSAKWILLSYSSTSRGTAEELNEILNENCSVVEVRKINYKRNVMANMKSTNEWIKETQNKNQEFLFLLNKG